MIPVEKAHVSGRHDRMKDPPPTVITSAQRPGTEFLPLSKIAGGEIDNQHLAEVLQIEGDLVAGPRVHPKEAGTDPMILLRSGAAHRRIQALCFVRSEGWRRLR